MCHKLHNHAFVKENRHSVYGSYTKFVLIIGSDLHLNFFFLIVIIVFINLVIDSGLTHVFAHFLPPSYFFFPCCFDVCLCTKLRARVCVCGGGGGAFNMSVPQMH